MSARPSLPPALCPLAFSSATSGPAPAPRSSVPGCSSMGALDAGPALCCRWLEQFLRKAFVLLRSRPTFLLLLLLTRPAPLPPSRPSGGGAQCPHSGGGCALVVGGQPRATGGGCWEGCAWPQAAAGFLLPPTPQPLQAGALEVFLTYFLAVAWSHAVTLHHRSCHHGTSSAPALISCCTFVDSALGSQLFLLLFFFFFHEKGARSHIILSEQAGIQRPALPHLEPIGLG